MITHRQFDEIQYLAEQIEAGDNFEEDVKMFVQLSRRLERDIYDQVHDAAVLRELSRLQPVGLPEKKRTFWNTVMPKSTYGMYDRYQQKEHLRDQVRAAAEVFERVHDLLHDDVV
ncbi:MAG: hypothetical protein R2824_21210 [Saprospiraceae bacterium]|nr:hypothetical protein [Lewinella sp.]